MADEPERTPCGNRGGEQLCAADDPLLCSAHWNLPDYHPKPLPKFTAEDKANMLAMLSEQMENAPHMYERDEAYWQSFLGGELPDPKLMPQNWSGTLQAVAQRHDVLPVKVDDLIELVWKDNASVALDLKESLKDRAFWNGPQFFKVGFRTCKDTFSVTAKSPAGLIDMMRQSERAMEEIAMAKARGWETLPILLRPAIQSPSLDRTELRVYIEDRTIRRVSTAPYAFHTQPMARQLAESAWPTLRLIAVTLPVKSAWCDVFYHDGAWWLCDMNPDLPTTWPGHFAYCSEPSWKPAYDRGYTYMAHSNPNPKGEFNKFCRAFQLPTGSPPYSNR